MWRYESSSDRRVLTVITKFECEALHSVCITAKDISNPGEFTPTNPRLTLMRTESTDKQPSAICCTE